MHLRKTTEAMRCASPFPLFLSLTCETMQEGTDLVEKVEKVGGEVDVAGMKMSENLGEVDNYVET